MVLIRTMALRRMAASLLTRSLATTQLIPQAASLRQCSMLHTPAQRMWNAWTPAVASGRICEAARAFSSEATSRVADAVAAEIEFEKEDYSPPPVRCRMLRVAVGLGLASSHERSQDRRWPPSVIAPTSADGVWVLRQRERYQHSFYN